MVGIIAAPWIADVLTTGVANEHIAEQQRELSTFLLRFFVPQILLYALGAVAVAVLYAKRKLAVTAMAPIGLTIVVVAAMVTFRLVAGPAPGLDLSTGEQLILALGGTLGVVAFVGIPTVALWRTGFRLRPAARAPRRGARSGAAPVGLGRVPALDDRPAPARGDRRRQHGRGRHARVPGRLGVLPRAVRGAGAADPHGDPP